MAVNFKIYNSTDKLPNSWDALQTNDIFLKRDFLKGIEIANPDNISIYYVGVFSEDELVGIAIIQHVKLYAKEMFRETSSSIIMRLIKDNLSRFLKGNILVVGNLMHTGQHGVFFDSNKIHVSNFVEVIFDALNNIQKAIKVEDKKKIRLVLFKDYFENDTLLSVEHVFRNRSFQKVKVQPNMIMKMRSSWSVFENYISEMNTKYRTRYKRAVKKFGNIEKRELTEEEVKNSSETIYKLYLNVSNNASFNTFLLPENHFSFLKSQLKQHFKLFGYYLDNKLVGFYTLILNNNVLETYFLGYDEEHQYNNQLYLNMLYDMAGFGINNKFSSIVYARTAMEIKSSVGAKPQDMFMYIKHTSSFANTVLKLVFNFLDPTPNWEERNPFK